VVKILLDESIKSIKIIESLESIDSCGLKVTDCKPVSGCFDSTEAKSALEGDTNNERPKDDDTNN
jgi:hypothetical protein